MRRFILFLFIISIHLGSLAQHTPDFNGTSKKNKPYYAFTGAVLHIDSAKEIKNGTLIIQEDKIIYAGKHSKLPKNTIVTDLKGKHIYPSFIDLNSSFGIKKIERKKSSSNYPQYNSSKSSQYYWNEAIKPEQDISDHFSFDKKSAKELRKIGFGLVLTHVDDGIVRGGGSLVALSEKSDKVIIRESVSEHYSFKKGSSSQVYPSSLMGSIALLRQYFYDLDYYKSYKETEDLNLSLEAGIARDTLVSFIDIRDKLSLLRAQKVADEFSRNFIYTTTGDSYQEINTIQNIDNVKLVVPLNFPKPFDVSDPFDALYIKLHDLKHWELAPANPANLAKANISFALSSNHLEKGESFLDNLRKAVQYGLSKEKALAALTIIPAQYIGQEHLAGTLEENKLANFIITDGDIFIEKATIHANYVLGEKHEISPLNIVDVRGDYNLNVNQIIRTLKVSGSASKPSAKLSYDIVADSVTSSGDLVLDPVTGKPIKITRNKTVKADISVEKNYVNLSYQLPEGVYRLSGTVNFDSGSWDGKGQLPNGKWIDWSAVRKEKFAEVAKQGQLKSDSVKSEKFNYPMMAYGWDSLPKQKTILIKGATVWTLESDDTEIADVLIIDGKIKSVGQILDVADKDAIIIDGKGKHLTPGIIDEHSHIAISRGVNEGSHAVTAEVQIGSVIRNDDINIYRQLSGGVTACQLLHGSANPVGGQSGIIKLRWGKTPEEMKIKDADGFIKFALGENVKQSNWGSYNVMRFPQTRMGVEQVYYDAFIRAKEYEKEWQEYNKAISKNRKKSNKLTPPKKDLQLDALLEILNKERFVSCHSYVQSEINMLMHVADSMGFTLNTFTHILEGYKVADKMLEHGAGGSTFSDWWAYKYEVKDAIPYNASLMNQMGIVTAINSDDAEMGRRLNQEAAKGVKYGGMTEIEALKMVTLNPAKLLHLDHRMGSIKEGKDADLVLWSDNPLSIYAKAEKTIIDGIIYYDNERDEEMRKDVELEKLRIVKKMLEAKNGGASTQPIKGQSNRTHVCTSIDEDEL